MVTITVLLAFHIVVCGLDSVVARRWINGMLVSEVMDHMINGSHDRVQVSLLVYNDDGQLDVSSVIPMIDGGTEGQFSNYMNSDIFLVPL